jgi:NAD dependent epimerase/dehydratase family
MIVFQKQTRLDKETKLVVLFGTGLIGTSVCKKINKQAEYSSFFLPFDWNSPDKSRQDATRIFAHLSSILFSSPNATLSSSKIAFVWSAGKAGFTASKKNMVDEVISFDIVLDLVKKIAESFPTIKIFFHLLSSVGGLFEGQRLIHDTTRAQPKRYYGQLKYEQEKRLLKLKGGVVKKLYRPTSVYGFNGFHQRMGLISTLVSNGIKNQVSTIFGRLSTLRDYVLNDDIGAYIEKNLFHDCTPGVTTVHLLGSGKPSSIYEIRHFVEQVIGRKIYLQFHSTPETENTTDITVNSSALPVAWTPTDVKCGIRHVKESILSGKVYDIPVNKKNDGKLVFS